MLEHDSHGDRFQVQTFAPLTLHVLTAYFPGWSARLNDTDVPLNTGDDGLIDRELPTATRGELAITLGHNPGTHAWLDHDLGGAARADRDLRCAARATAAIITSRSTCCPVADARLLGALLLGFGAALLLIAVPSAPLHLRAAGKLRARRQPDPR